MAIIQSEGQLKGNERNSSLFISSDYLVASLMSADMSLHSGERAGGGGAAASPPLTALNSWLASLVPDDD